MVQGMQVAQTAHLEHFQTKLVYLPVTGVLLGDIHFQGHLSAQTVHLEHFQMQQVHLPVKTVLLGNIHFQGHLPVPTALQDNFPPNSLPLHVMHVQQEHFPYQNLQAVQIVPLDIILHLHLPNALPVQGVLFPHFQDQVSAPTVLQGSTQCHPHQRVQPAIQGSTHQSPNQMSA